MTKVRNSMRGDKTLAERSARPGLRTPRREKLPAGASPSQATSNDGCSFLAEQIIADIREISLLTYVPENEMPPMWRGLKAAIRKLARAAQGQGT